MTRSRRPIVWLALAAGLAAAGVGCKRHPRVVPVTGVVFYNGKPLPFGSILFQPDKGQTAAGDIRSDGSFTLSSYADEDGAVPGAHRVSVSCFEGQRPGKQPPANGGSVSLGKLLIPLKYTRLGSSGLGVEVKDAPGQTFEFKLEGPPVAF